MEDNDAEGVFRSRYAEKMKLRKKTRGESDSYFKLRQLMVSAAQTLVQSHNIVKRENCKRLIDLYEGLQLHRTLETSQLINRYAKKDEQASSFMALYDQKVKIDAEPESLRVLKEVLSLDLEPEYNQ